MNPQRRVLVGVSGGIAAYKSADLVSKLAQADVAVSVVMTAGAVRFVQPATFAALSGRSVHLDLFDPAFPLGAHIELARQSQLLCVAPASADFLGKIANGIADDLLTTLYLCYQGPVLLAPAMNHEMWAKPSVQRNVDTLRADGVTVIGPEKGWLSCRQQGVGRMVEPAVLLKACLAALAPGPLDEMKSP